MGRSSLNCGEDSYHSSRVSQLACIIADTFLRVFRKLTGGIPRWALGGGAIGMNSETASACIRRNSVKR